MLAVGDVGSRYAVVCLSLKFAKQGMQGGWRFASLQEREECVRLSKIGQSRE